MSSAQKKSLAENNVKFKSIKAKILELAKEKTSINEYKVVAILGILPRTAIGRLSELVSEGKLYISSRFNDGKNSTYKYVSNKNIQRTNKMIEANKRYQKWIEKGKRLGYFEQFEQLEKVS